MAVRGHCLGAAKARNKKKPEGAREKSRCGSMPTLVGCRSTGVDWEQKKVNLSGKWRKKGNADGVPKIIFPNPGKWQRC